MRETLLKALNNLELETKKMLEQLVERDTPMKVEIGTLKNFKYPICANCKIELNKYHKNKYCKECGQKLDWCEWKKYKNE